MRQKKIRGHNRRHKQIDKWRLDNLSLDLTDYLVNQRDRYYAKIRVQPWSDLSSHLSCSLLIFIRMRNRKTNRMSWGA